MLAWFKRQILLLAVAAGVVLAWLWPTLGKQAEAWVPVLIAGTFVCQGAVIRREVFGKFGSYLHLLACGSVVSLILGPLLGWTVVSSFSWPRDLEVGFVLMCCMGPTLVSGIVIATQAGGELEAAAFLTIVINLIAILVIPWSLDWSTGAGEAVDSFALIRKLALVVLAPALLGQVIRQRAPAVIERRLSLLKLVPVFFLGTIIYISLSRQSEHLLSAKVSELATLIPPSLAAHACLLGVGFFCARKFAKSSVQAATSLAFVCSQKTLPVAVAVWSTELAVTYPLAIVPVVVFHMVQIYGDSLVAGVWERRVVGIAPETT